MPPPKFEIANIYHPQKLSRRDFIPLFTLTVLGAAKVGWDMSTQQSGSEVSNPEGEALKQFYANSTVLLALPLNEEKWLISGGVFISPTKILTARHVNVSRDFFYARGPKFAEEYSEQNTYHNIADVIPHPIVDISIIKLAEPVNQIPIPIDKPDPDAPVTVGRVGGLEYAQSHEVIKKFGSWNQLSEFWPMNSSFITRIGVTGPGDSGGPVFQHRKLVGISHGSRLFLGSIYVNLEPFADWINTN